MNKTNYVQLGSARHAGCGNTSANYRVLMLNLLNLSTKLEKKDDKKAQKKCKLQNFWESVLGKNQREFKMFLWNNKGNYYESFWLNSQKFISIFTRKILFHSFLSSGEVSAEFFICFSLFWAIMLSYYSNGLFHLIQIIQCKPASYLIPRSSCTVQSTHQPRCAVIQQFLVLLATRQLFFLTQLETSLQLLVNFIYGKIRWKFFVKGMLLTVLLSRSARREIWARIHFE